MRKKSLNDEQIAEARRRRANGEELLPIAEHFGVSKQTISRLTRGSLKVHCKVCYTHLPDSDGRQRVCSEECGYVLRAASSNTPAANARHKARIDARKRLSDRYPEEFEALYWEELAKSDVPQPPSERRSTFKEPPK